MNAKKKDEAVRGSGSTGWKACGTITGWKACVTLLLALTCSLRAATVTADSGNTVVDTMGTAGDVAVTMHRATADVLENRSGTAGIDDFLRVKGTDRTKLASQPILPGELNPPQTGGVSAKAGLVADGVTPLLFKFLPQTPPVASGTTYDLEIVQRAGGLFRGGAALTAKLLTLQGSAFVRSSQFTLDAANPNAFAVVEPIDPADIDTGGSYDGFGTAAVICDLVVRDAVTHREVARYEFGIRKPPVVLVHGYNADEGTWGDDFRTVLKSARGPNFVMAIDYGTASENWLNTFGTLNRLSTLLNAQLQLAIENSQSPDPAVRDAATVNSELRKWTFTRYDAVGHSQGGVLLRLLCSSQLSPPVGGGPTEITAFQPFRNGANHNVGRFHRVVTIGSPHAGSTIAHLAIRMQQEGVEFDFPLSRMGSEEREKLLQPKFMIDDPQTPGRYQTVQTLNKIYLCDPLARIHLLCATINEGVAPSASGGGPGIYDNLYLNTPDTFGTVRWANWLVPLDSDGVVDIRSQSASETGPGAASSSRIAVANKIAHADDGKWYYDLFGTNPDETETASTVVADKVVSLLDGDAGAFLPFSIPPALHQKMNDTAVAIESIVAAMADKQQPAPNACYLPAAPAAVLAAKKGAAPAPAAEAPGDQTLNFTLQPPPGESPNGPAEWTALVYGPAGVSAAGLSLATSGAYGEQLALTVAASVQGQVVLVVRFPSTSGKTVIGRPQVVLDRPPGAVLSGIVLSPAAVQLQADTEVPLTVSGVYDGTISSSLFTNPANTTFQSSNAAVAAVDADGRVKLLALGTATITATYNGTLAATSAVTVLDAVPVITSVASAAGTVGQAFTHQLTASQTALSFAAAPLPPGLTLNTQTGLISGTPTTQGATSALVSVTNANGTGSRQVDFTVAGPAGAPTDVGTDAGGVSEQKPAGTLVGRLVTVDPNPLDTFTYQLVAGTGATDNASFTITGDQVLTAVVLSRAVTPSVSIRVRTTDSTGATFEKAMVLPVMAPPAITRQPDPRTVFTGESAIFAVETTGLEPLSYQWQRNGVDVAGAASRILELPSASAADAGAYTVTVWNGDGTITSAAAALAVNPASYGKWASALPQTFAGAVLEPMGDYNADGIVNFLEFAFGVQPNLGTGVGAQPSVVRDAGGIVLTYRAANGIEPLVYRIMKSPDLLTWTEHQPALGEVTRTDLGSYTEVQVRIASADARLFVRMNVSTP